MLYETKSMNDSVCVVLQNKNYAQHVTALKTYCIKFVDVGYSYNSTDGRHTEYLISKGALLYVPEYMLSYIRILTDIEMIFNMEDVDNLVDQTGSKFSIN